MRFQNSGGYGDYMWDPRKDPMDPSAQPDDDTSDPLKNWLDLGLLNARRGGRFREPAEYTPPAKKAQGGILRRRPIALQSAPQADGGREGVAPGRHMAIPIISTTIIIHHKKPRKPSKPKETKSKEPETKMAKGGKVRGAGIEKRGGRFQGIF